MGWMCTCLMLKAGGGGRRAPLRSLSRLTAPTRMSLPKGNAVQGRVLGFPPASALFLLGPTGSVDSLPDSLSRITCMFDYSYFIQIT